MKQSSKLGQSLKENLAKKVLDKRLKKLEKQEYLSRTKVSPINRGSDHQYDEYCKFDNFTGYQQIKIIERGSNKMGISSPFFKLHEKTEGGMTIVAGKEYINYANYNYLGFANDFDVCSAAKQAIDDYGTSVSASRIVSGEREIQQKLERELASIYGVDDSIVFVSGHATNVTTIGYLFDGKDLILHDALAHNSVIQGVQLSGAKRIPFSHNSYEELDRILSQNRKKFKRVLIIIEGLYSMDGDYPELEKFVEIKRKHKALLMVDEAHSLGTMGKSGLGIREHCQVKASDVDIWMGTLSKTLASCGGYIAGEQALVEHLRYSAPGFLYSVGIAPAMAAASYEALKKMQSEPERVRALQVNGQQFLGQAKSRGLNVGLSRGGAIVPILTGSSVRAAKAANALFEKGINVQPIFYPAVEEKMARLRFFLNAYHTEEQIDYTINEVAKILG